MKTMKMALLAGAALAVTSAGAYADELDALKTSMENMGVIATPVADAPEGATITWGGQIRQALTYESIDGLDDSFDLKSGRARLWVDATTPTSVGDVDVHIRIQGTQNQTGVGAADTAINEYWGVWHITPELSFSGGLMGNLAFVGQNETYGHTLGLAGSFATTTDEQLRLTYASGPVTFAIAIDDGNDDINPVGLMHGMDEMPDAHAMLSWAGDSISVMLGGGFQSNAGIADDFVVSGAIDFNASDAIKLHLAAAMGEDNWGGVGEFWGVAGNITANVTEATYVELSGGYKDTDVGDWYNVNAGIYWNPVSQLRIGLQADHGGGDIAEYFSGSLVTWWSF